MTGARKYRGRVWTAPGLQRFFESQWRFGQLQSCVRPVDVVGMTAGPDGILGSESSRGRAGAATGNDQFLFMLTALS